MNNILYCVIASVCRTGLFTFSFGHNKTDGIGDSGLGAESSDKDQFNVS